MAYLFLIAGFAILIKAADLLVSGASSLAWRFGVSPLMIGLTVVAFGTSAPELVVNITAALSGTTDMAIGNILGSNIANVLLILGISALIYPLVMHNQTIAKEIPLSVLAAGMVIILSSDMLIDGADASMLSRSDGMVLLGFFAVFLYYVFAVAKSSAGEALAERGEEPLSLSRSFVYACIGMAGLVLGGKLIVDGAVSIAVLLGMSEAVIGLTVVAIGTSLPELATSAVAAWKRNTDIAVGNVIGSNIFNIFFVLGITSVVHPLPFTEGGLVDATVVLMVSALVFVAAFVGSRGTLERWQGGLFVCMYAGYLAYLLLGQG